MDVFRQVFPQGTVQILGGELQDLPGIPSLEDARQGPAAALAFWASRAQAIPVDRWWVLACDQVRWTPGDLEAWHALVRHVDPEGTLWVGGLREGMPQPLGGFLGAGVLPLLAVRKELRLLELFRALPHRALPGPRAPWVDVDDPEELRAWLGELPG